MLNLSFTQYATEHSVSICLIQMLKYNASICARRASSDSPGEKVSSLLNMIIVLLQSCTAFPVSLMQVWIESAPFILFNYSLPLVLHANPRYNVIPQKQAVVHFVKLFLVLWKPTVQIALWFDVIMNQRNLISSY
jgi:hypothetical protein